MNRPKSLRASRRRLGGRGNASPLATVQRVTGLRIPAASPRCLSRLAPSARRSPSGRCARRGTRCAPCAWSHRAVAAGLAPAPRRHDRVELRGPHLVLADVGSDVRVAVLRELPELLDDVLRLDDLGAVLVLEALALAPLVDLAPPLRQDLHVG